METKINFNKPMYRFTDQERSKKGNITQELKKKFRDITFDTTRYNDNTVKIDYNNDVNKYLFLNLKDYNNRVSIHDNIITIKEYINDIWK